MKSSPYMIINNLRVHYLLWGAGDDGRPIVLIHGLAYTAHTWDFVAPLLAGLGWKLLAPDLRGHGLSDKPEGEYSFDVIFQDISAFIEAMDIKRPLLVGHSWGGMLALDYATRVPIGSRSPSGLVLVDGGIGRLSDIPGSTWERVRDFLAPSDLTGLSLAQLQNRLRKTNSTWTFTDEVIPSIMSNYDIDENEIIAPRLPYERHMDILKMIWDFDACEHYPRLNCPVLMIPTRPKEPLDRLAQLRYEYRLRGVDQAKTVIKDFKVYWMMDSIHDVPLQRPKELADLIHNFGLNLT